MKITAKWLEQQCACGDGITWFNSQKETDGVKLVNKLVEVDEWQWANWLIVRLMTYKQYISYAVFAAEQVIDIYEKQYPADKRPREAIRAVRAYLKNSQTADATTHATYAVVQAAYAAAHAAYATYAVAQAAYAAAHAAYATYEADATYAAYAAAHATYVAPYAAVYADKLRRKIITYGLKLLEVV